MPFDGQPMLRGSLLELRPLRSDDFAALYRVAADPLMWALHPNPDRYQEPVFRAFFEQGLACGGALLATDVATRQVIGTSRFDRYDEARNEIEIGWTFLARSHWGGVYNGEMKQLMLAHAFRYVKRVVFVVGPGNLRSRRALEKIGATHCGSRTDDNGEPRVLYEITPPAFDRWVAKRSDGANEPPVRPSK
jgi:RimJ/RimL family protein N-acetyltransferase